MKRLVMFDMDGVLFDSMPYHAKAWRHTMLDYGVDLPETVFYMNEGRTGKSTVSLLLGREVSDAEWREYYAHKTVYFESYPQTPVMPGAVEAVKAVRSCGVEATIVTGSGQGALLGRIESTFPGLFNLSCMVTSADVEHGKPSPEPYLRGLQKSGCPACDAIVVENAPLGVRSGHAAGCYVVAVNTGPLPDSTLLDAGADVLFHSMSELAGQIGKLLHA